MTQQATVSVITPIYNNLDKLKITAESVLGQKGTNFEFIVVDGACDSESVEYFNKLKNQKDIFRFISEPDRGIYDAMNKGVKIARGTYIIFLGAGDEFFSDSTLAEFSTILDTGIYDIVYGYIIKKYSDRHEKYKERIGFWYKLIMHPISHQALFSKRTLFADKEFDLNYKICSDQDWIMGMYKDGKKFKYIDRPVVLYDMFGISATKEGNKLGKAERVQIQEYYYPNYSLTKKVLKQMMGRKEH